MTASELHRKLLFCGYDDLTAYLNDNPVNRYIHKQLLGLCTKYNINVPMVTLFNEIYYVCLKIQSDRRPGEEVQKRYIREEEEWLESRDAAMLVISMVWAIIQMKQKQSFNDECFLMQITQAVKKNLYVTSANDLMHYMKSQEVFTPSLFKTLTTPIDSIPKSVYTTKDNPWRAITDNLSSGAIEWYVSLYHHIPFQIDVFERIYDAFTVEERNNNDAFLRQLRVDIENGGYLPGTKRFNEIHTEVEYTLMSDDEIDYKFSMGLARAMDEEVAESDTVEKLKQERDEAVRMCEEHKKMHELDLARLGAEIAELKKQLQHKTEVSAPLEQEESNDGQTSSAIQITVEEMIDYVKREFSQQSAIEFSLMLYSMGTEKNYINKDFNALVNSILAAVKQRDARNQTFEMPNVQQFNNNPQNVYNNPQP